jgi:hypothetical protein
VIETLPRGFDEDKGGEHLIESIYLAGWQRMR